MVTITETAAQKASILMQNEKPDLEKEFGLRMKVVGGGKAFLVIVFVLPLVLLFGIGGIDAGCGLNQGGAVGNLGDRVITQHDLKVFVDPRSILYLAGSTLDYNDGLMESGFKIENPNANSTCGCGESFSV